MPSSSASPRASPSRPFESLLPPSVAVLRAMPNTPAIVGRGVTGLAAGSRVERRRPRHGDTRCSRRSALCWRCRRSKIDEVSAISGSGPGLRVLPHRAAHPAPPSDSGFTPGAGVAHGRTTRSSAHPSCSRLRRDPRRNCAGGSPARTAPPSARSRRWRRRDSGRDVRPRNRHRAIARAKETRAGK